MKKLFALITLLATLNGAQAQEIVAHRGYWKDNAQNSIASLQKAQAFGCWGSEFDLHLTADNCVVVNHDREIKKTDIQKSTDENCVLVLELKPHYSLERENLLIDKCLQALKDADLLNPHRAVFISFSYHICKELAKKLPDFTVQYLEGDKAPVEVKADGINGIDYHFSKFQKHPEWVQEAKELGMSVNAWTVDKPKDIREMIALGVEQITTNEPELVRDIISGKK